MTQKPNINKTYSDTVDRRPAGNSGLAKVAVQYSADTFVVNQSLVLRINICGENRHLRQAAKRCASCEKTMKKELIDRMKQTKRLKLSRWQTLDHFFIVIFILLIPGFTLFNLFEIYVTDTYDGVRSSGELISTAWPWIIPAIAFYFIQHRRLRFREVKIEYSDQEFQEAIERTAKEYEWRIELNSKNVFRAYRPSNWTSSWGEMITIIKDKDRLLLNSICDPNKMSSVASFGWNKRNIDTFIKNLIDVKKDIPVQESIERPEKEWTFKKVIIRLLAYPFCLFLIGLGVYMIFNPVNWKSQGAGIGAMTGGVSGGLIGGVIGAIGGAVGYSVANFLFPKE